MTEESIPPTCGGSVPMTWPVDMIRICVYANDAAGCRLKASTSSIKWFGRQALSSSRYATMSPWAIAAPRRRAVAPQSPMCSGNSQREIGSSIEMGICRNSRSGPSDTTISSQSVNVCLFTLAIALFHNIPVRCQVGMTTETLGNPEDRESVYQSGPLSNLAGPVVQPFLDARTSVLSVVVEGQQSARLGDSPSFQGVHHNIVREVAAVDEHEVGH